MQFPLIPFNGVNSLDKANLKNACICVFKAVVDRDSIQKKINFELLESFVGSFDKNARDTITNSSIYIDDVVNSSSQFIRLFSNIKPSTLAQASTFVVRGQPAVSIGFYKADCAKLIGY